MSVVLPNLILASFEESFDHNVNVNVTHILNVALECDVSERVDRVYAKHGIADDCENSDMT